MKKCVMMSAVVLLSVINPAVNATGCSGCECGGEYNYRYGAEDLVRELEAIPTTHRLELENGRTLEVSFVLDETSVKQAEHVLTRRDSSFAFIGQVYACDPPSPRQTLEFTGDLVVREILADDEPRVVFEAPRALGSYSVDSLDLDNGTLTWREESAERYPEGRVVQFYTSTGSGMDAMLARVYLSSGNELNYVATEETTD